LQSGPRRGDRGIIARGAAARGRRSPFSRERSGGDPSVADQQVVLSGMRSTGKIHLGNYFGAVKNWVELQDRYSCYYFAADWHALTSDYADPSQVAANTLEVVADWIAAGLDPERSVVFVQSMVPEHAELHLLLSMIAPLGWLERVPTYKEQIRELETRDLSTYGFLGYPLLQTADILVYRADFVPVGEDQASHLELGREIVRRFNGYYGAVFPEPKALFTSSPKVPGLDGRKMSKSYGNAIHLADPPEAIRAKCMQMFTDPLRVRRTDPGHPEGCNLYEFHKLLSPPELAERVGRQCRAAEIGCVDDKRLIADVLIEFLAPMRRRREELLADRDTLHDVLLEGSRKARERAGETMAAVREAMGLDYRRLLAGAAAGAVGG
jgi:tryptophanyl-tRNA synthetase